MLSLSMHHMQIYFHNIYLTYIKIKTLYILTIIAIIERLVRQTIIFQ